MTDEMLSWLRPFAWSVILFLGFLFLAVLVYLLASWIGGII